MDLPTMIAPELEDLTICSFCHLSFNDNDAIPKLFSCRHFFCLKCVNLMLRDGSDDIYCIHCWKRTELQGPEPKADNLPTYNAILYLSRNLNTFNPDATICNENGNGSNNNNNNNNSNTINNNNNYVLNNHGNNVNVGIIGQFTTKLNHNNNNGSCIIDIDDRDRSPSISSSSESACGSLGGGVIGNNNGNGNGNSNNNDLMMTTTGNCNNIEKFKIGENCMTHAMPNTLWCSICRIQLCRACAGTDEHRMHPVKNQIEAKESLHQDISTELKTMQQTLNDLQQLLQKQRDFLVKILESCTTLKTQIETELVNPIPNVEITEIRERLAKAYICLELLEKQTPGDALKLYTTLHTERQRLLAKYQEMFLQCKLDDLIKSSGFVFDFDLIKKTLIRLHNAIVNGDANVANLETLGLNGFDGIDGDDGGNNGGGGLINSVSHNPIMILANYCISQLYSRQMLALKQQQHQHQQLQLQIQQQQQQQQQQQKHQQYQQQMINNNNTLNMMQQINQHHQNQNQQHHQHQQSLLPNGLLNSMIAHAGLNSVITNKGRDEKNNNNNNINDNSNSLQTTYAQALQQSSTSLAQRNAQQSGSPNAKTYADIINSTNNNNNININNGSNSNSNKINSNSPSIKQQQQQQLLLQQQQQHQHHQKLLTSQQQLQSISVSGNFPELAPIGTKTAMTATSTPSSTSSSSSSSTAAISSVSTLSPSSSTSALSVKRSSTHLFATTNGKKFNGVGLSFLHLQHHTMTAQQQQQQQQSTATPIAVTNASKQQQQPPQQQQHQSPLAINPRIHIYPIYFFNIEMNGKLAGRLLIEVRSDVAPKMAKNFNSLVTQEFGFGYKGCQVFQCWENESIITGDYELNNGRGGRSVLDEPYFMPDDTKIMAIRGSVGMRRSQKRHDNMGLVGSQFRIILREMRGFTGIFGFLIDGLDVVERIAQTGDSSGKPQSSVVITNCGKYEIS